MTGPSAKIALEGDELHILEDRLDYVFTTPAILIQALTHKSFANEFPKECQGHNERLEFLGDAVLDFVISDRLMSIFPDQAEGNLSKQRATMVSESALAAIARHLNLGNYLRMGKGEEASGGRDKDSILSDALEAVLAAVYQDSRERGGTARVEQVIDHLFMPHISPAGHLSRFVDYKTELQEYIQKIHRSTVRYGILQEDGPDHEKRFESAVYLKDQELGRGVGRSKKQAEQAAASHALQMLMAQLETPQT
ncbi:MAG: ribonuclease III [Deltaproteobacteria bacterium]|nr:ribonuclease III [Deltaproteobacteria bacterium]